MLAFVRYSHPSHHPTVSCESKWYVNSVDGVWPSFVQKGKGLT